MIKFNYCGTHIKDEEYMNKMSRLGWNVKSLVEGFWIFEKGKENEYIYRIYYFRGMSRQEINSKIDNFKKSGIELVNKYSFWGIFRAKKNFELYKKEEQLLLCKKIRKPMLVAIIVCPIMIIILFLLSFFVNNFFHLLACLVTVYYFVCLYLTAEYTRLIKKLSNKL